MSMFSQAALVTTWMVTIGVENGMRELTGLENHPRAQEGAGPCFRCHRTQALLVQQGTQPTTRQEMHVAGAAGTVLLIHHDVSEHYLCEAKLLQDLIMSDPDPLESWAESPSRAFAHQWESKGGCPNNIPV